MEYDFLPQIFGLYSREVKKIKGKSFYRSEDYNGRIGIWWCGDAWWIGLSGGEGQCAGVAYDVKLQNTRCPQVLAGHTWFLYYHKGWKPAGKGLTVRCVEKESKFVSNQKFSGTATSTANPNSIF